jgi:hypothetical protein
MCNACDFCFTAFPDWNEPGKAFVASLMIQISGYLMVHRGRAERVVREER